MRIGAVAGIERHRQSVQHSKELLHPSGWLDAAAFLGVMLLSWTVSARRANAVEACVRMYA